MKNTLFPEYLKRMLYAGLTLILGGCSAIHQTIPILPMPPTATTVLTAAGPSETPFQPLPTATITPTPTPVPEIRVFIPAWIPDGIKDSIELTPPYVPAADETQADITLSIVEGQPAADADFNWVFALAAPFPTVSDGISWEDFRGVWSGHAEKPVQLLLDETTGFIFSSLLGDPKPEKIRLTNASDILDDAWSEKNTWAVIPFEEIVPRWKILRVSGLSPFDRNLDLDAYPLAVKFSFLASSGPGEAAVEKLKSLVGSHSNRDETKMTRVMITGVTALVRSTAERMEMYGIDYPIEDILPWLVDADITHISNEVSFYDKCPPAIPVRLGVRFCSDVKYIQLLDAIDADVIELTGNHLVDFGREALNQTLKMYADHGMLTYGGGENLTESQKPLVIENNGNHIAFIGCNRAGPPNDWAAEDQPGSAPCDLDLMTSQIHNLLNEGILPIVTFQHYEVDQPMPGNQARQEMEQMSQAGAVIVSGSQAHYPHGFRFTGENFIHYGTGNLFFDQMWSFNRREFLDRHIFYDGRYLGTEILTAMLEDFARPRPMTEAERTKMLTEYFTVSGWQPND